MPEPAGLVALAKCQEPASRHSSAAICGACKEDTPGFPLNCRLWPSMRGDDSLPSPGTWPRGGEEGTTAAVARPLPRQTCQPAPSNSFPVHFRRNSKGNMGRKAELASCCISLAAISSNPFNQSTFITAQPSFGGSHHISTRYFLLVARCVATRRRVLVFLVTPSARASLSGSRGRGVRGHTYELLQGRMR